MWSPSRLEWMPLPRPQNDTFHLEYTYHSCRNLCFSLLTKQFRLSRQFFYGRVQTYHYDDDDAADNWNKSSNMTLINRYKRSRVSVNPVALMWALILHLLIDFVVSILFSLAIYTHACTATRNRNDVSEVLLALRSLSDERPERDTKKKLSNKSICMMLSFYAKDGHIIDPKKEFNGHLVCQLMHSRALILKYISSRSFIHAQ